MVILAKGKISYYINEPFGVTKSVLCTTNRLFDTGAQPNLVAKRFLTVPWIKKMRNKQELNLCSATNDPVIILRQTSLRKRLGRLQTYVTFNVMETLSVNIIIGKNFIDKYVTGIHPFERKVKLFESRNFQSF